MTSKLKHVVSEIKAGKKLLLRFFGFSILVLLFPIVRAWYSYKYFQFELVVQDGFMQYSLFGLAFLFLWIYWKPLSERTFQKQKPLFTLIFSILALLCAFFPIRNWDLIPSMQLIFSEYLIHGLGTLFLFITFFGFELLNKLKLQLATFAVIATFLNIAPILISQYWQYSSILTIIGLRWFLDLFQVPYTMEATNFIVTIKNFKTSIGPPCAGIHSLVAFASLYLFGVLLTSDRTKNVSWFKVLFFFILGLISVYLLNSFRVMLILLVGAYYDAEFAINTFHNNIGAILFLIFFVLYSGVAFKYIGKKQLPPQKKK